MFEAKSPVEWCITLAQREPVRLLANRQKFTISPECWLPFDQIVRAKGGFSLGEVITSQKGLAAAGTQIPQTILVIFLAAQAAFKMSKKALLFRLRHNLKLSLLSRGNKL